MKGAILPREFAAKMHGYTIVEVMIVLAVSGVMFLIAANFISGKQAKTAWNLGVNTLAADVQSKIDSVSDGQYTDVPTACTVTYDKKSEPPIPLAAQLDNRTVILDSSLNVQGTNASCVFMGYMFHFTKGVSPAAMPGESTNNYITSNQYAIIPLGGARVSKLDSAPIIDIHDSALAPLVANAGEQDLGQRLPVPQGLQVEGMKVWFKTGGVSVSTDTYNLEIILSIPQSGNVSGTYATGGQTLAMLADSTIPARVTKIRAKYVNLEKNIEYVKKAVICLTDGTRHGTVTIGENGDQVRAVTTLGLVGNACV